MFLSEVPVSKISMRDVSLEVKLLDDIVEKEESMRALTAHGEAIADAGFINCMHQYE